MSKALATPAKKALPSKEASLFKELLTLYETKQLRKGQKTADQILKKFPEHGETLCMKGLLLTHMGRREEGIDLVKKGVRLDLTSHICWHVLGLIQKGEKNYEEALKLYTQALRFDKENLNILRDAAQLQTQLRHFEGLVETRHTIVKLRPTLRQHWIALAVAHHLNGNLDEAKRTLEHYRRSLKNVPDYDIEHSETLLYHIQVLEEMGEFTEALAMLDESSRSGTIVDRTAIIEARARLLSKMKSEEAEKAWHALIEHNPDCFDYYKEYLYHRGAAIDSISERALSILRELSAQLPQASAPQRLALTVATGNEFRELVKPYLLSGLTKGIPSLFSDVKTLYRDDEKRQAIEEIVETARAEFATTQLSSVDPTIYLWTLYFLAQHYSCLSRPTQALELVDLALSHTPTLPELLTCKARILKRAGDLLGGARWINEARLLDGQDRFLNTKCAKYLLRAGLVEEASTILGLFTKKDAISPGADLEDMQSLLYLTEEADAHYRHGKPNLALKKYMAIKRIFDEVEDDQYDFHGYNMRKFTINVYLKLLKWEDQLRAHPAYVHAALQVSRIFVAVHDDPSLITASTSNLTDAQKKAKKKAKKAAQKAQEDLKKGPAPSANEDKALEATAAKDEDPDGLKLITSSDALEQAAKLLSPLNGLATDNIDIWIAMYDVAIRRKKLLQAVRALKHVKSLDAEHPELHIRLVHCRLSATELPQQPPPPIGPLFNEALTELLPEELSLETYNSQYLQHHSTSVPAILASAKVMHKLQSPLAEIEATVFTALGPEVKLNVKTAFSINEFLIAIKSERTEEFRMACDAKFELSTMFKSSAELAALKTQVLAGSDGNREEDAL